MGAITPITSGLNSVLGAVSAVNQTVGLVKNFTGGGSSGTSEQNLALLELQERQRLQEAQLAQSNALSRDKLALEAAQADEDRRAALRRAVARQRANFGGSGISSADGGSAEAVLLGLVNESETELQQRSALDRVKTAALDLDETQTRSLNLLQTTQLQQRQKLNSLF